MLRVILTVQFWSLFILSSFKFAVGMPSAMLLFNFTFLEGFIFGIAAGFFGIWFWLYISKPLFKAIDYMINHYRGSHPKPKKRIFTKRMRRLAKLKMKYGLIGIALITPTLISIPVGTIIAARIYKHDRRLVFLYLALSVVVWSALFSALISIFHVQPTPPTLP
jgi:hypothetical protein